MTSLNTLSGGKSDDLEALTGGFTNKKDDAAVKKNHMSDIRFSITAITVVAFSVIGIISVGQDLKTYNQLHRGTKEVSVVIGGELMMTDNPDDSTFDGHINGQQTNSLGLFTNWLFSSEPHGGEKTIAKVMENVVDSPAFPDENEITFLWEAGAVGSIANEICRCFPIRMATTFGSEEMGNPAELKPQPTEGNACGLYNVNLGTHAGTQRAKDLGLISRSPGPNFISSPFLPEIASLFTAEKKGRVILVVPNTSARIQISYEHLKRKGMFDGSMLEFVSSDHILANNYLTHVLSGKWGGGVKELTEDDFAVAVGVAKTKLIVFTWADNRKMVEYVTKIRHLDPAGVRCMYPPENPYSQEQEGKPRPPPPEKTPEELATDIALKIHNYWDNRLFDILREEAQQQAASIL